MKVFSQVLSGTRRCFRYVLEETKRTVAPVAQKPAYTPGNVIVVNAKVGALTGWCETDSAGVLLGFEEIIVVFECKTVPIPEVVLSVSAQISGSLSSCDRCQLRHLSAHAYRRIHQPA